MVSTADNEHGTVSANPDVTSLVLELDVAAGSAAVVCRCEEIVQCVGVHHVVEWLHLRGILVGYRRHGLDDRHRRACFSIPVELAGVSLAPAERVFADRIRCI